MVINNSVFQIKKSCPLFALLLIICLLPFSQSYAAPDIQHWSTENGARVYFFAAPELPMIDIEVVFDAGSARDGDNGGLALLTNSLLDDGAGSLSADQIAETFEGLGANLSSSSERDMAVISLRSLTDQALFEPALDTFALILQQPTFPEDSFKRDRNRMLISLRAQQQSPGDIADKTFYKAIYGSHPYATPTLGSEETLNALSRDDIIAHYKQYYVARNATIAIVGNIDRSAAEKIANKLVSKLPEGSAAPSLPAAPDLKESQTVNVDHPSTQTHVLAGHPGVKRGDPDYFPLYVGNHILGGGGLVSRIIEEIREKRGLSYSAYSYFHPMRESGPFTIGLQTSNKQTEEALKVMRETVQTFIDEGPTAKELEASKRSITGGFPLRIASNSKILGYLAVIGFYGMPLDYLDTFNSHIEAVTLKQIKDAFKRRVHPDKMVTVTVGSAPAPESN